MPDTMQIGQRWVVKTKVPLGEGGFGQVYRATDTEGPKGPRECAAKVVDLKDRINKESFEEELKLLTVVEGHESIIELYGKTVEKDRGWMFLEIASGGELFDRLIDSGSLSERAAWPYAKAICNGLQHCYDRGVIHRDLKLENIMLSAEDPNAVKLIDFGLAVVVKMENGKPVQTILDDNAGTQAYRAPEVYSRKGYNALKVDVWAMGIVLFSLCSGFFPLQEAKEDDWRFKRLAKDQAKHVGACESIFKTYKRTCPFSPALKSLIDGMLTIDPTKRLSVDQMCNSEWLAKAPSTIEKSNGVVYRSAGDDMDDDMEDEFSVPDDAVPLVRQKANRLEPDALVGGGADAVGNMEMADDLAP